jgi:GT2 family glycosyltransferase
MNRIAFLLPTFNRAHFLVEALDAVTGQMAPDDVLLVIDDGSTDDTAAVVERYRPRVGYVRQDNRGKSAALNRALAMTSSAFVWICDDDDVTAPGAVALLHGALADSAAGFVFGRHSRFRRVDGHDVDLGTGYWPDLSRGSVLRHVLEDAFVMQNATLIRRSALEMIGPFDEGLARSVDYDMFVRLALAVPAMFVDAVVFAQRKHDGVRGPQGELHAASRSMSVWADWDRRVFDKVAAGVPLAQFEALFDSDDPRLCRRAALLQRACVWARHQRWEAAAADLHAAVRIAPAMPWHDTERGICARMLNGVHGFAPMLGDGPGALAFGKAIAGAPLGRAAGWAMARGIVWRLRHHERAERRAARAAIGRIARLTRGRGPIAPLGNAPRALPRLEERSVPRTYSTLPLPPAEQGHTA